VQIRLLLSISLLSALPVWSQANNPAIPANNEAVDANADDAPMLTPPPVNGEAYPTTPLAEERSNYLRVGVGFVTSYSDNVLGSFSTNPVSDLGYSVSPTIELDQTRPRWTTRLTYDPGFTLYQRTAGRDETDQGASMNLQYRVADHVTATVRDSFEKTSNVFNRPDLVSLGAVYGSSQPLPIAVIPPIADTLSNTAKLDLTYQFSANGMVGAGGAFTNLQYPNQAEVPGLYDSSSRGGSVFYSHRMAKNHYLDAQFQYSQIVAFPIGPPLQTEIQTLYLSYTVYLKPHLSLSLGGGPQHYQATGPSSASSPSWSPAAGISLGWQGQKTTFAASYARTITGGGGLAGAFQANNATLSGLWRIERTWSIGVSGNYAIYKNVTPFVANPGGHTFFATAALHHPIGQYFDAEVGYSRVHQTYSDIAVVSLAPNTDREYIQLSYHFTRPLGR